MLIMHPAKSRAVRIPSLSHRMAVRFRYAPQSGSAVLKIIGGHLVESGQDAINCPRESDDLRNRSYEKLMEAFME